MKRCSSSKPAAKNHFKGVKNSVKIEQKSFFRYNLKTTIISCRSQRRRRLKAQILRILGYFQPLVIRYSSLSTFYNFCSIVNAIFKELKMNVRSTFWAFYAIFQTHYLSIPISQSPESFKNLEAVRS